MICRLRYMVLLWQYHLLRIDATPTDPRVSGVVEVIDSDSATGTLFLQLLIRLNLYGIGTAMRGGCLYGRM